MENLIENILKVYNLATENERTEGEKWYGDAREICVRLATKHGIELEIVCYVMAALSPNNKWQRNILDTVRVLDLYSSGELADKVSKYRNGDKTALKGIACTYTANLLKAFDIIATNDTTKIGGGLKTNNFAKNIFNLNDDNITIDFHAISIALGQRFTVDTVKSANFKGKNYTKFADAYKEVGGRVGLLGKHVQAITWVAWRNLDRAGE